MIRRPPRATRTDTLCPSTTLVRSGRSTVPTHSLKAAHCSSRCWQGIVPGRGTLLPAAALSGSCSLRQSRSFVSPRKPRYLCTCRRTIRTLGFTYENADGHHRGSLSVWRRGAYFVVPWPEIGRAHVCTPVNDEKLVCSILHEK